jgi:hypothetical protein
MKKWTGAQEMIRDLFNATEQGCDVSNQREAISINWAGPLVLVLGNVTTSAPLIVPAADGNPTPTPND